MKLDELIKLMRNAACDVFPSEDAFCYTESSCEKNYVMEMHIYLCISMFVSSHSFAWSRWNFAAGSRTAVFLMRELMENRKLVGWEFFFAILFLCLEFHCSPINRQFMSRRSSRV
jgi:cancer susceptibility candidate protein 1